MGTTIHGKTLPVGTLFAVVSFVARDAGAWLGGVLGARAMTGVTGFAMTVPLRSGTRLANGYPKSAQAHYAAATSG